MSRGAGIGIATLLLAGCGGVADEAGVEGRWYSAEQVAMGEQLYTTHCIGCHLELGAGTTEWKRRDALGNLPPPPLNGSAHTWHHELPLLLRIIDDGGAPFGGVMPPFRELLDDGQKRAVVAYLQSLWPDAIYRDWERR